MPENDRPEIKEQIKGSSDQKENTRSKIAQIYVWAFFIVIGIVFIIGACNCFKGPLGFIVGYYFKATKE